MAILENRVKIKNSLIEWSKFIFFSVREFFVVILIIISCCLLYFSAPQQLASGLMEIIGKITSVGAIIYKQSISATKWVYDRSLYFKDLEAENLKLKLEIASLKNTSHNMLIIQSENRALKEFLNVPPEILRNSITAKVIGMSINAFGHFATIQAGSKDGVKLNDVVRANEGLVGKISEVSPNYSTVMLISDHDSRIPVITSESRTRGILAREGDDLKILHLKKNHNIAVGELVYTSGDGKIYPKSLIIAKIKRVTSKGAFVEIGKINEGMEFVVIESKD